MITLIGLPSTLPPKSSTAICAAVTDPWPVGVDAGPFMSVRTPILTISSETWAGAACDDRTAAAIAASRDIPLADLTGVLPFRSAHWPYCLTGSLSSADPLCCNYSAAGVNAAKWLCEGVGPVFGCIFGDRLSTYAP